MITRLLDNPRFMKRFTAALIAVSVLEWVVAGFVGWVNSVAYVSHLSQLAITISLIPWYQGCRVEQRQAEEDVVQEIIERTDVQESPS